jgi:hypothetical protein
MKSKTIIGRMILEILILVMVFTAVDNMTSPSESTAIAVQEAVNKQQLEPICMVEVFSAIESRSFMRFVLLVIQIAALLLLCSDPWALWRCRRRVLIHTHDLAGR